MTKLDEIILLDYGFHYGFSGETLWRVDKKGTTWCCMLDSRGEDLEWSWIQANETLSPRTKLTRQEFDERFDRPGNDASVVPNAATIQLVLR